MAWAPFTYIEEQLILETIHDAEVNFSGEIRVHVERYCKSNAVIRTKHVFEEIGMTATELRNGILIYLAINDRTFAIYGDVGIYDLVEEGFWDQVKDEMALRMKNGQIIDAICYGIEQAGKQLSTHFPPSPEYKNELPDDISYAS